MTKDWGAFCQPPHGAGLLCVCLPYSGSRHGWQHQCQAVLHVQLGWHAASCQWRPLTIHNVTVAPAFVAGIHPRQSARTLQSTCTPRWHRTSVGYKPQPGGASTEPGLLVSGTLSFCGGATKLPSFSACTPHRQRVQPCVADSRSLVANHDSTALYFASSSPSVTVQHPPQLTRY